MCWSHALVCGLTSKRPSSDGGVCSGQLLMMWSAVCSGSQQSHAALSASVCNRKVINVVLLQVRSARRMGRSIPTVSADVVTSSSTSSRQSQCALSSLSLSNSGALL